MPFHENPAKLPRRVPNNQRPNRGVDTRAGFRSMVQQSLIAPASSMVLGVGSQGSAVWYAHIYICMAASVSGRPCDWGAGHAIVALVPCCQQLLPQLTARDYQSIISSEQLELNSELWRLSLL